MILVLSNERDIRTGSVVNYLNQMHVPWFRVNRERLTEEYRISALEKNGDIQIETVGDPQKKCLFGRITKAWAWKYNRRTTVEGHAAPERHLLAGEYDAVIDAAISMIPAKTWVNSPDRSREAERKIFVNQLAREHELELPNSMVTQSALEAEMFLTKNPNGVVCKPLNPSFMLRKDMPMIFATRLNDDHISQIQKVTAAPTYFQEFIEKRFEIRVILIGDQTVSAATEFTGSPSEVETDWRVLDESNSRVFPVQLDRDIEKKLAKLAASLQLEYAAVDLVVDRSGKTFFLELNPGGSWDSVQAATGVDIDQKIAKHLRNSYVQAIK